MNILNKNGVVIGQMENGDAKAFGNSLDAQVLRDWLVNGVPRKKDTTSETGEITRETVIAKPNEDWFGLALADAIEDRGWSVGAA